MSFPVIASWMSCAVPQNVSYMFCMRRGRVQLVCYKIFVLMQGAKELAFECVENGIDEY